MQEEENSPDAVNERYFSTWYFSLGVAEGVGQAGGIISEVFGWEAIAMVAARWLSWQDGWP